MTVTNPHFNPMYATVGSRVGAYILDGVLFSLVYFIGFALSLLGFFMSLSGSESMGLVVFAFFYIAPLFGYLVFTIYLGGKKGYTPGKKMLGLRVVDASTGQPLGVGRFLLRNIVLGLISTFTLGIGLIVLLIVMSGDTRRQGWHDRVVNAVVIPASEMNKPAPAVAPPAPTGVLKVSLPDAGRPNMAPPVGAGYSSTTPVAPPLTPPPANFSSPASKPSVSSSDDSATGIKPGLVGPPPGMVAPLPVQSAPAPQLDPPGHSGFDDSTRMAVRHTPKTVSWSLVPAFGVEQMVAGLLLAGRDPDASLVEGATAWSVQDAEKTVSKTHALIGTEDGALWIEDWNSTNGVLVRRGESEIEVSTGERTFLEMGDSVLLGDFEIKVRRHG